MINYYEVLQVMNFAEIEVIKASYRALSRKYHPDTNMGANGDLMCEINEAFNVLSNPKQKDEYDKVFSEYLQSQAKKQRIEENQSFEEKVEQVAEGIGSFFGGIKSFLHKHVDCKILGYDIEETNSSSEDAAFRIHSISYCPNEIKGNTRRSVEIEITVENQLGEDVESVEFVVLAWDTDGIPLRKKTKEGIAHAIYCATDDLKAGEIATCTFEVARGWMEDSVGFMSCFASEYTDSNGKTWTMEIMDAIDDIEGMPLEDIAIYYFEF